MVEDWKLFENLYITAIDSKNVGYMKIDIYYVTIWSKIVSFIIHAYLSVISFDKIVFIQNGYFISDDNWKANSIKSVS